MSRDMRRLLVSDMGLCQSPYLASDVHSIMRTTYQCPVRIAYVNLEPFHMRMTCHAAPMLTILETPERDETIFYVTCGSSAIRLDPTRVVNDVPHMYMDSNGAIFLASTLLEAWAST